MSVVSLPLKPPSVTKAKPVPDLAQLIACQNRIVANVIDFVRAVVAAQDHVVDRPPGGGGFGLMVRAGSPDVDPPARDELIE
jgi:hypothetical protein